MGTVFQQHRKWGKLIMAMELLSPAGNRERLDYALHYGADAVYLGAQRFGLRAFADNFSMEDLHRAAQVLPAPLLAQHVPVDAAGGEV